MSWPQSCSAWTNERVVSWGPGHREAADPPAGHHPQHGASPPRCSEYKRSQEVDRALHDRAGVGRPQSAEFLGPDRLDGSVEQEEIVLELVPLD
jgi:hypothetical protein